jgi:hypothetical protein
MLNALRYGLVSFLKLSKPFLFFGLSAVTLFCVFELSQVAVGLVNTIQLQLGEPGAVDPLTFRGLSSFGAQSSVMNALVLFFLSIPVAGQFAQEYRFNMLANTFLMAPNRIAVFFSKTTFALLYVVVALAVLVLAVVLLGPLLPIALQDGTANASPVFATSANITWTMTFADSWWRVLLYILGYMVVVISLSIITKSQTLGALLPLFYLGLVETVAAFADFLVAQGQIETNWIPEQLRFFRNGQAWINNDPGFPQAGLIYFGVCLVILAVSLILFVRRDTRV